MQQELEAMTRDVILRVKETFFDLHAGRRTLAIAGEEQAVIGSLLNVAETRYAAGEGAQVDVLAAQAEATLLKRKILDLRARENALAAQLNTLLDRRADTPVGPLAPPPETGLDGAPETLFALAAENRPEIQAARARVEQYELERKLMKKEYWPDYQLGLEYRDQEMEDDQVMFTVSVELPVWRSRVRAGVREADRMRDSGEADREAAERQSALEVQDALFKWRTARDALELYRRELLPQAEARFQAGEAGYRAGRVDFIDLLESERFLLDVRVMAAMAEGDAGMQFARLERAVGADLPGKGDL
jgi:outer membrane protein TolC